MEESQYLYLSHNVSNLVYHIVCPAKYRRVVFDETVDEHLRQICLEIEKRYDYIVFLEIGTDKDHVHFLVQSTETTMGRTILVRRLFCGYSRQKSK